MPYPRWMYCVGNHNYEKNLKTSTKNFDEMYCKTCGKTKFVPKTFWGQISIWMPVFIFLVVMLLISKAFAYKTGDIIFIKSQTAQSKALRDATGSEWTHVGIIVGDKVAEETSGLKMTPIKSFIARSKNKEFKVFRHFDYSQDMNKKLQSLLKKYDKPYDIYFEWSESRQYCSEFVYKLFVDLIGQGVGELQTFKEMNLDTPAVKALIKKRYQDTGKELDLDETIVTPISQMLDDNLIEVTNAEFIGDKPKH